MFIMLMRREFFAQFVLVVIIDQGDGTNGFNIVSLPFFLDQSVSDQITDGF